MIVPDASLLEFLDQHCRSFELTFNLDGARGHSLDQYIRMIKKEDLFYFIFIWKGNFCYKSIKSVIAYKFYQIQDSHFYLIIFM